MRNSKRIVIIAGEESGDLHAAALVRQLKTRRSDLQFSGIGGNHMQQEGVHLVNNFARYGVTGISEVVRHLGIIHRTFKEIKAYLAANKPDLLILVDFPAFNLRLLKYAKRTLGIRILYYISPQIWAWKADRIHLIHDYVDRMAVILPFEKPLYEKANVPVSFVGHPLVDTCKNITTTRDDLKLPRDKKLIAMLPGSRIHEIERHMPVLIKSAMMLQAQFDDLHLAIPLASTIDPSVIHAYFVGTSLPYTLIHGQAVATVACSDCVVVASGTASLECALLAKPMCIIYKASLLTYLAASKLIKVKYLGLCNLLKNEMVVPELLQYDCNPIEITRLLTELLTNQDWSEQMQARLRKIQASLSSECADCTISDLVERELLLNDAH